MENSPKKPSKFTGLSSFFDNVKPNDPLFEFSDLVTHSYQKECGKSEDA